MAGTVLTCESVCVYVCVFFMSMDRFCHRDSVIAVATVQDAVTKLYRCVVNDVMGRVRSWVWSEACKGATRNSGVLAS